MKSITKKIIDPEEEKDQKKIKARSFIKNPLMQKFFFNIFLLIFIHWYCFVNNKSFLITPYLKIYYIFWVIYFILSGI